MRAALAVHALQALWIESIADDDFDVGAWLEKTNRTLYELGNNQTHAVRLGVVSLKTNQLTYWSAGHLPLFVVFESLDRPERALLKPNPALGYLPHCKIEPLKMTFDSSDTINILLATDGVFPKGTMTNAKDMFKVLSLLKRLGDRAMDKIKSEDDKSVIWFNGKAA